MAKDSSRLAVIDDDEAARMSLRQMLRLRGYSVSIFASAEAALANPEVQSADCIISDVKMPGIDGEAFLRQMKTDPENPPIIMITGHGDVGMAVRCLKAGAYDFVEKPFDDDLLLASVHRAVEASQLRRERESLRRRLHAAGPGEFGRFGMVGQSPAMEGLYAQIEMVARSAAPAVITGETGSGKELAAHGIHSCSQRKAGPFVAVNAGALPETMLESELFGHVKGAYTGALNARDGALVSASGGTLLLDEIESISPQAQVGLLRVFEDGRVQPVGSDASREVDVRILAATKTSLRDAVRDGRIREDFYHRIAVLDVAVPPLRDRRDDIPLLAYRFIASAAEAGGIPAPAIPESALAELMRYSWPGNVRELRNVVERMLVTASGGIAGSPQLGEEPDAGGRTLSLPAGGGRLREEMERTERQTIRAALREQSGEINSTAEALGISRRALYERMKKYELRKEDFRA